MVAVQHMGCMDLLSIGILIGQKILLFKNALQSLQRRRCKMTLGHAPAGPMPSAGFFSGNIRYADTRGGSSWRGPQMRVGLLTTAIFGDLSGYFFGNLRDKASNII